MKYVIHAVGPDWWDPQARDLSNLQKRVQYKSLIRDLYRRAIMEAERLKLRSIALPPLSTASG